MVSRSVCCWILYFYLWFLCASFECLQSSGPAHPPNFRMSNESVKEGWLTKQGHLNRRAFCCSKLACAEVSQFFLVQSSQPGGFFVSSTWKTRYFVLMRNRLAYYQKRERSAKPRFFIYLPIYLSTYLPTYLPTCVRAWARARVCVCVCVSRWLIPLLNAKIGFETSQASVKSQSSSAPEKGRIFWILPAGGKRKYMVAGSSVKQSSEWFTAINLVITSLSGQHHRQQQQMQDLTESPAADTVVFFFFFFLVCLHRRAHLRENILFFNRVFEISQEKRRPTLRRSSSTLETWMRLNSNA